MTAKLKKIFILIMAPILAFGNTDLIMAPIVLGAPQDASPFTIFLIFAAIANVEAVIWYHLGKPLVAVLGDLYLTLARWHSRPRTLLATRIFLIGLMRILRAFYEWEKTKSWIHNLLSAFWKDARGKMTAISSWLLLPGARSVTAILFGMQERPWAFMLLLVANTIHVAFSFFFWKGLERLVSFVLELWGRYGG